MIFLYIIDIFREMFIGMQLFGVTITIEFFFVCFVCSAAYFITFVLNFGFDGLMFGMFIGQISGFLIYFFYFFYGKHLEEYHKLKNTPKCNLFYQIKNISSS